MYFCMARNEATGGFFMGVFGFNADLPPAI
jgi:hypothetical protein